MRLRNVQAPGECRAKNEVVNVQGKKSGGGRCLSWARPVLLLLGRQDYKFDNSQCELQVSDKSQEKMRMQ